MQSDHKNNYPVFCLNQHFPLNNYNYYEAVVNNSKKIRLSRIRVELKVDEWFDEIKRKWNESLISNLSRNFELLVSLKIETHTENIHLLLEQIFSLFEEKISAVELNSSIRFVNNLQQKKIIRTLRTFRKRIVVQRELLDEIKLIPGDAISINYKGTESLSSKIRKLKKEYNFPVWITGLTVFSDKTDQFSQIDILANIAFSGADRIYWNNLMDLSSGIDQQDDKTYTGLIDSSGVPKIACRLFEREGFDGIIAFSRNLRLNKLKKPDNGSKPFDIIKNKKTALVLGGAGFIGTNVADRYLSEGYNVRIFDNLSRPGVEENLKWLINKHGNKVDVEIADIRDINRVNSIVKGVSVAFNFAAQVALTTSLQDPIHDFEVNIKGTINLLESLRHLSPTTPLIFTSTNKVYGGFSDLKIKENETRYEPELQEIKSKGINEQRPLDFHSPYGCSKGSADQYVLDYCRSYNLKTIVFRMSCIYGPHQFGTEDQGWVAHFLIQTIKNNPIILYGNGKQVRDILFVTDLVNAFRFAEKNIDTLAGNAFNIGGGVNNTISLIELLSYISELTGIKSKTSFSSLRTGDHKYYVSDISKFSSMTGWKPAYNVKLGVAELYNWLVNNYPFGKNKVLLKEELNNIPEKKALTS